MEAFLDFEKPIATLEKKLHDLRELSAQESMDLSDEISALEKKVSRLIDETYSKLTPWQKVQLSRHPNRPYCLDYIQLLFPDFMELHGDRAFGDDQALVGGMATWQTRDGTKLPVLILGNQKGRSTKQKMERNFGMARPEGYRKAIRLMRLAEKARMPVITFIDTPGAFPDIEAEERGQSAAIAESIQCMFSLSIPVVAVVIGEGGSGGALAIGVANRILMQEYSTYSVISPEGCASILWSDARLAEKASERLKMSPTELIDLKVIDSVVPEPKGGAHRDWNGAARLLKKALDAELSSLIAEDWTWESTGAAAATAMAASPRTSGAKSSKPTKASKSSKGPTRSSASGPSRSNGKGSTGATAKTAKSPTSTAPATRWRITAAGEKLRAERLEKFRAMGAVALGRTSGGA